jgi:hypothetical protein
MERNASLQHRHNQLLKQYIELRRDYESSCHSQSESIDNLQSQQRLQSKIRELEAANAQLLAERDQVSAVEIAVKLSS